MLYCHPRQAGIQRKNFLTQRTQSHAKFFAPHRHPREGGSLFFLTAEFTENTEENKMKNLFIFLGMILFVVGLWVGSIYWIEYRVEDLKNAGVFGDQFGAVNALFSGLAFAGLIYTILLQRDELNQTRQDIKNQTKEFEEQNKTLDLQRFEMSFFNLLSQHNEMVSLLTYGNANTDGGTKIGRNALKSLVSTISKIINKNHDATNEARDCITLYYDREYKYNEDLLGIYFRSLYSIFNFIDSNENIDKLFYSKIVRSQMSESEVGLLFMNGLSSFGKSFVVLIEKFHLLNNLPDGEQDLYKNNKALYKTLAYE